VEPCLQPCTLQSLIGGIPADGVRVLVTGDAQPMLIDPDLMAAALMNILDNAARMGAQQVQMDVRRQDALAIVRITDDGPGVSAERLQALQAALAQQRYEAPIGLGLMLADLIARAHRGSLSLPPSSAGFTVEISLPQSVSAATPHRHRDLAM
jgi:two-component system OmpR family sensor kinase